MQKILFVALGLATMCPAVSTAGPIQERAALAETALSEKNGVEALKLLREAVNLAWQEAPISVTTAIFVSAPAAGYGIYNVRPDNVFPAGEPLLVYFEPIGFDWDLLDGLYTSLLTVDFELTSQDGKVLGGQKGFGRFDFKSHVPNTEYMANLTLTIDGAPADDYVLVLTVNDELGGETTNLQLPFSIR